MKTPLASIFASLFGISIFTAAFPDASAQNQIVLENQQTGNPSSEWDISGAGDLTIQGFATDISVNHGGTVHFKIKTDAALYHIDIYRLGYYQGNGARKVGTGVITAALPQTQPADLYDSSTGLTDCGNWSESAHWDVPATAVSGIYIAKLTRDDTSGASHIAFVVRDDASHSDLFFQTSDTTWQAYNNYGGNSLYVGSTSYPGGHAAKVSYNRPFLTRNGGGGGGAAEDWVFNAEYPMVRFLEANGYDMTYTTDIDSERSGNLILNHKVFMSVGHDEYWSATQRANVTAARDAGVHLAFFGGNDIYWKTRWEASTDGSATPYRTLVCYKEGTLGENACGTKCDPLTSVWTGLWRDGCQPIYTPNDGCAPENSLSGQISWDGTIGAIMVPDTYKNLRFWRNTAVAGLGSGQTATLTANTLGYEWDWQQYDTYYPPGRIVLSSTLLDGKTHHLSLYRASSGALVFGAGTVQWSWGLDGNHDRGGSTPDANMQQATVNLLADMSVEPGTLQAGLVPASASTDVTAPISVIELPADGGSTSGASAITISGTASDTDGVVAGVEVSVDGGTTWSVATGTMNWSFAWTPAGPGVYTIESRAFDDSGNIEIPGSGESSDNIITFTVTASASQFTIFHPSDGPAAGLDSENDQQPLELGVKFRASVNGTVTGVRFYKGSLNGGTHIGHLWSSDGTMLGEVTFTGESASGWQEADFSSPIAINSDTTYIASYHSEGYYADTIQYFISAVVNGPLSGLADGDDGPNGVYIYSATSAFPSTSASAPYNKANYWVDVVFNTSSSPDVTPPTVVSVSPNAGATAVAATSNVKATFSEAIDPTTVSGASFLLVDSSNAAVSSTVSYDTGTRSATLTPSTSLAYNTTYTATLKGGATDPRIKDLAGNALASDYVWSFTTGAPPPPPPTEGPGGPILVVSSAANPFSRYFVEILRAEGLNEFTAMDISLVTASVLTNYDLVILGDMPLSPLQVSMFSDWANSGGNLIAMRPDKQLAPLLGLTDASTTLSNAYLHVFGTGAGAGIVTNAIQFHGVADCYTLNGATELATLYSDSATDALKPAVTVRNLGASGGHAAAFTFDLARSVVYTRQGNPAWAGQKRDGQIEPIRSDDMFFGNASFDPEPDWVNLNQVAIPQADEQQRLLANMILQMCSNRLPLPKFWYFPRGVKAVVLMTGDDHGNGGTVGRFQAYEADSPVNGSVDNWECVRSTSYIYPGTPITDAEAAAFVAEGFEIGTHVYTGCADWTPSDLQSDYTTQLTQVAAQLPSLMPAVSERTHCIAWSDWATQPKVEITDGIRLDLNYYYWPPVWVQDRPGFFTGSGMPMRFADLDGTIIDCYQATTQMTDESGQSYPFTIDSLLDGALGPQGYYGVFSANMHTDSASSSGSDAIIASAQARHIPVVSGRQMLVWLDGRNGSSFGSIQWSNNTLNFTVTAAAGANGLQAMVPTTTPAGQLAGIAFGGSPLTFTNQTIKGVEYAFFPATNGQYQATYTPDTTPPVISAVTAAPGLGGTATISWTTDEPSDSLVSYGTDPNSLTLSVSDATLLTSHSLNLSGLASSTTYYFVVTSTDASANSASSPASPAPPASFTTSTTAFVDTTAADFGAGTPSGCAVVSQMGDGELILAPMFNEDFPGATLSGNWSSDIWNPGGSSTVAGGLLTVNGAHAATTSSFGPGSSIEFQATFEAGMFENVGFASDFAFDNPWVTIGTSSSGNGVYARANDGTDILISSGLLGAPHRYQIVWNPANFVFYVDGSQVATINLVVGGNMVVQISDFTVDAASLSVDWLRVSPYAASCAFQSRVFDAGGPATWSTLSWTSLTPDGTSLGMSYRIGNTPVPDSSWTTFIPVSSSGSPLAGNSRYFQYGVQLGTSDTTQTPVLEDVTISYNLGADNTAPTITSRSPAQGANDVSTNTAVSVTFSEPLNTSTVSTSSLRLRRVGDNSDVSAMVSSSGGSATLLPNNPLLPGQTYQVTVAGTITDFSGNPLGSDVVWTFSTSPVLATQEDTTVVDFGSGSPGACALVVSQFGDGEVILAPALNQDFSGATLPVDWTSGTWSGGGSVSVAGGLLAVDGAYAETAGAFGPGGSLDFVATFGASPFQHAGLATDSSFNSYAMFSTLNTSSSLYARTSDGANILIPGSWLGSPHHYRIDWNASSVVFWIDGSQVASNAVAIGSQMRPIVSDFNVGAPNLTVDWVRLSPYTSPCTFNSRVIDAGQPVTWHVLAWTAITPTGTTLNMSYRTGPTPTPDGSWSGFAPVSTSGGPLAGSSRYFQYSAQLSATDTTQTPVLEDVTVTYILCSPPAITQGPSSLTNCAGSQASFSVTASGSGLTYQWRKDGTNIDSATASSYVIASVSPGDAGSYDVLVGAACGSPAMSDPATLTVNTGPMVSVNSPTACASALPVTMTTTLVGGTGPYSYSWTVPNGANDPGNVSNFSASIAGIYGVVVTDANGCTSTSAFGTLTVQTNPTVSVNSAAVCAGMAATLTATTSANNPGYLWSPGGQTTASITVAPASTTTYTVTVIDGATSCANTGSGTVTINPLPVIVTDTTNQTACPGSQVVWSVAASGAGLGYQWIRNGTNLLEGVDNFTGVTTTSLTNTAVTLPDSLAATNGYACIISSGSCSITSTPASLTINPPLVTISNPAPISIQCPGQVPAAATNLAAFENIGGSVSSSNVTVTSMDSILSPGPNAGTVIRTYTLTDTCGQMTTSQQTITVQDTEPPVLVTKSATVTLDSTGQGSITPADVFDPVNSSDNCGTVTPVSVSPGTFTFCNVGQNTVTLIATDPSGNRATNTATVNVSAPAGQPTVVYVDASYGNTCSAVTFPNVGGSGTYYVGYNAFNTVQAGVNAVAAKGTVNVAAGTYVESVTVPGQLTLVGAGSGSDPSSSTIINGGGSAALTLLAGGTGANDRLVVSQVRLTGLYGVYINSTIGYITLGNVAAVNCPDFGIELHNSANVTDLQLTDCLLDNCNIGLRKSTTALLDGLSMTRGTISRSLEGIYAAQSSGVAATAFTNITIDGTVFNGNMLKGIYVEALSSGLFQNLVFTDCGTNGANSAGLNINLKYGNYQNIRILNSVFTNCGSGDPVNGAGLDIEARDDAPSYSAVPASLTGVTLSGLVVTGSPDGIRFGEAGKTNAGPLNVSVQNCSLGGNVNDGIRNESLANTAATLNWWGSDSGPSGAANPYGTGVGVSANVTFSPWLGDGTDTSAAIGFQPNASPTHTPPTHLAFTTEPGGANLNSPLSPQPVVSVLDANNNLTPWANPQVTVAIQNNPSGGVLTGSTPEPASGGVATFTDLAITVAGGSGFTLSASAPNLSSATSSPFDIANPAPSITSLAPSFAVAGDSGFVLTVNGANFGAEYSTVRWNGSARPTTYVSPTQLTAVLSAGDIASPGTANVTVFNVAPGGGESSPATFNILSVPSTVYVNATYTSGGPDDGHTWDYDAFSTVQDGINRVAPGGTVNVAAGTYGESDTLNKSVTLLGANQGAAGCGPRGAESIINAGAGNAITITAANVVVDGFELNGVESVVDTAGYSGALIQNNTMNAAAVGVDARNITTTVGANFVLKNNCITLLSQLAGSTPTVGVGVNVVTGPQAPVIQANNIQGAFYGYLLYGMTAGEPTVVEGGSISGAMQGVSIFNINPLNPTTLSASTFGVSDVTISGFAGNYPALAPSGNDFQAGVYVFTTGPLTSAQLTGTVSNVTVLGTGNISSDSSGLYFIDFSTVSGVRQQVAVQNCNISTNANRGIFVSGSNAVATVTGSSILGNGSNPFGSGGNSGFGVIARNNAQLTVSNCFIVNPATVTAPYTVRAIEADANTTPLGPTLVVTGCSILNNGNPSGLLASQDAGTLNASGNWWGSTSDTTIAGLMSGVVDFTPYLDSGTDTDAVTTGFQGDFSALHVTTLGAQTGGTGRIQEGINTVSGGTVYLQPGTFVEGPQIVIDKDITMIGDSIPTTIIKPSGDTGNSFDSRGWWLVQPGMNFNLSSVTLDGTGRLVWQAIRSYGLTSIDHVHFTQIQYNASGPDYEGIGIVGFDNGITAAVLNVSNCQLDNIGRLGIWYYGNTSGSSTGNTYAGKGPGNWVDYGIEVEAGANALIASNTITGNQGIASIGGLTSAGIIADASDAPGTKLTVRGNGITSNTYGVTFGVAPGDTTAALLEFNDLTANDADGIRVAGGAVVDAGDCTGSNVTGLGTGSGLGGSSAGGNILSGYGFDSTAPWAIENLNGASPAVLAYQNAYGAIAGNNVSTLFSGAVLYDQSGPLLVQYPGPLLLGCLSDVPTGAADLPGFIAQGGVVSASSATVGFSDAVMSNAPNNRIITRTYTVTDVCGQTTSGAQVITVNITPPVVTCPNPVVQTNDAGACGAVVIFPDPVVTDICGIANVSVTPPSGSFFPVGTNTVTVVATDRSGVTNTGAFTVTVTDSEAPVIIPPANITRTNDPGVCGAVVTFAVTNVTDNCGVANISAVPPSGNTFPVGTTTVMITATDIHGNVSHSSFTVTVNDTEPPSITCPANIVQTNDPNQTGAVVTFTLPSATDNCGAPNVVATPPSGSLFPVGTTVVNVVATDVHGNTNTCSFTVTINDLPLVTTQPLSITNNAGTTAVFTVAGSGTTPLSYQWIKNGSSNLVDGLNITGSTSNILTLSNVLAADAGTYSVVITNIAGSVTSSNATLTVIDPVINTQPSSATNTDGNPVSFTVVATGTQPLSYQWYQGVLSVAGATSSTLTLPSISDTDAGSYTVVISNSISSVTSSPAILTIIHPPVFVTQPISQTVNLTQTAAFSVSVNGTTPFAYQWMFNGTNINGATNRTFTLNSVSDANAGSYSVFVSNADGSNTSSNAVLTVIDPPSITSQPASRTNNAGTTATFTVGATGTAPSYQWFKGASSISGATTSTLTLPSVSDADVASYSVVLSNAAGVVTSSAATLTVIDAPMITSEPASRTNNAGTTATFTVGSTGTAPSYQWFKGVASISGATTATLTLLNVSDADAASYSVVLSNAAGTATSTPATLTVIDPPLITGQPVSITTNAGGTVSFSVTNSGTGPFGYQWILNGTNILISDNVHITGATNSTLTISNVLGADGGSYTVAISNAAATVTSDPAILTVIDPIIISQPTGQTNNEGSTVTFTVGAYGTTPLNYQWRLNGANVGGATGSAYTLTALDASAGNYTVVITNSFGSVTSSIATLFVIDPAIVSQPTNVTAFDGSTVTFSVAAVGSPTLTYQWQFDGEDLTDGFGIAGSQTATLTITNVSDSDDGTYTVIVTNNHGSVTSSPATLVTFPPLITSQPVSINVLIGQPASFSVSANGLAPFSYQWQLFGTNIPGATNRIYTIASAQHSDAGLYDVLVTDPEGTETSHVALLGVYDSPGSALTIQGGGRNPVTITVMGVPGFNYILQQSTSLHPSNWLPVITNPAPFSITITNVGTNTTEFYRSVYSP